jgi:hypothetical protein
MTKIYYQNNGCSISDTVFITPNGDQYPIRNITSVKVRQKDYWLVLLIGIFFLFLAYSSGEKNGFTADETKIKFGIGIILILIWWYIRKFILWIGSGGIDQEALIYRKVTTGGLKNIHEIYDAINASIANLQNR